MVVGTDLHFAGLDTNSPDHQSGRASTAPKRHCEPPHLKNREADLRTVDGETMIELAVLTELPGKLECSGHSQ